MALATVQLRYERFKAWQEAGGWNDVQVSHQLGVSKAHLSRILSGDQNPGSKFVAALLRKTDCPFEYFFEVKP